MASTSIPTLSLQINMGPTFGAALVGIVFAAIFHGITILQGIFYYRTYPKDRIFLKLLVLLLLILDTLSLALATQGVYTYLVSDFGNLAAIDSPVALGISNEPIVDGVVSSTVQLFQAYRIRALDKRWWPLSLVIGVLSVFGFANAIAASIISDTQISSLSGLTKLEWTLYGGITSGTAIDLLSVASISYLLHRNRNGFSQTNRMINTITTYVISNGLITTTLSLAVLISYVLAPTDLYCQAINFSLTKAYTNTLLASLNSRQYINRPTPSSVGTVLQFEAAPPSMDSGRFRGTLGGSSSKDAIAPLDVPDVPDVNKDADRLTQQSSYWRGTPTEKVSDTTWYRSEVV